MTQPVPVAVDGDASPRPPRPRLAMRKSLARLAGRPRLLVMMTAVPVLALVFGVFGWLSQRHLGVDIAVYRAGALALLHGEPLYDSYMLAAEPSWSLLPFTYPPSAALLFVPLAALPLGVAWGALAAVSLLAMTLVIRIAIGSLPKPAQDAPRWWASPAKSTLAFSVVFLGLEPVWRTIALGQINLILMAIIVLDILVVTHRHSRFGGVLVGIAAAVKLTPLIFIGHLLLTGRRKDAARAFGTFMVLQGLMFAISPHDVARYWSYTLFDTARIGSVQWVSNQSLNGVVNRLSGLAPWASKAALGISALLAIPAIWLMLKFHRRGQELAALLVTAFFALLASPISWSHHWVWAVPLIVLLVSRLPSTTRAVAWKRWLGAVAVAGVFVSCVLLILPNGGSVELEWNMWQEILGNAYLLTPIVLAVVLAARALAPCPPSV